MRNVKWLLALLACSSTASAALIPPGMKEPVPPAKLALDVGGGSLSYVSGNVGGGGGAWCVVGGYTPQQYITLEASYTGAAGNATGAGALVATIVEGDARLNPIPGHRVSPYLLAGLGWGGFHETQFRSDNSTMTIPLGGGIEVRLSDHLSFGGRVTYRIVTFDKLGVADASADNWSTTFRLGAKF